MSSTTGYKVRKVRELKGITQAYVADAIGIKQNTYSRMETGVIKIQEEQLGKIAEALGVEKDEIESFDEKLVFNNCTQHNNTIGIHQTINNNSEDIKRLYEELLLAKEQIIKQLEERIKVLEGKIEEDRQEI